MVEIREKYSGKVLCEIDADSLRGANLSGLFLNRANLAGCDLTDANLSFSHFDHADLSNINLTGANLYRANLSRSILNNANLSKADLGQATLDRVNLVNACLIGANLKGTLFYGTCCEGTNFAETNLELAVVGTKYNIPIDLYKAIVPPGFVELCKQDFFKTINLFRTNGEVSFLKRALIQGRIDGHVYGGRCACLVGTLAKAHRYYGERIRYLCNILDYDLGFNNPAEVFFYAIKKGDTPETNFFSKTAVEWCDELLANV